MTLLIDNLILIATTTGNIESTPNGFVLTFYANKITEKINNVFVKVWADSKDALEKHFLDIIPGVSFVCSGKFLNHETETLQIGLDTDQYIMPLNSNKRQNDVISNWITQIQNEIIDITDPFLKFLATYSISGKFLRIQTKIGSSTGKPQFGKHHSIPGGNLKHIVEMLKLLSTYSDAALREKRINREVMKVMILLHDIGKTLTFNPENPSELVSKIPCSSDSHNLVLLGKAVSEFTYTPNGYEVEITDSRVSIIESVIGEHHRKKWHLSYHTLLRELDHKSAAYGESCNSLSCGFSSQEKYQ